MARRSRASCGSGDGQGLAIAAKPGAVAAPSASSASRSRRAPAGGNLWRLALIALGGAMLGGLILNIMPCVFPILSLKALSLARASIDEREARREALAYTLGVVLVCLALGGVILALRAGGRDDRLGVPVAGSARDHRCCCC